MYLTQNDFNILDFIQTKDGRTLFISLRANGKQEITKEDAYRLYRNNSIVSKTFEIDGEQLFLEI